ncbi:MAG: hypothetical protein ACYC63_13080 [Armatimonadota bacterium]
MATLSLIMVLTINRPWLSPKEFRALRQIRLRNQPRKNLFVLLPT